MGVIEMRDRPRRRRRRRRRREGERVERPDAESGVCATGCTQARTCACACAGPRVSGGVDGGEGIRRLRGRGEALMLQRLSRLVVLRVRVRVQEP